MTTFRFLIFLLLFPIFLAGCGRLPAALEPIRTIEQWEAYRQQGLVPESIDSVYCSGGTLRLVVYLESADKIFCVDSHEKSGLKAYLMANPQFQELPIAGEASGRDNPEALLSQKMPPQLIVKADTGAGYDPVELTRRTGIPVLLIPMRDPVSARDEFDAGLRLLGAGLGKRDRAEEVIAFFDREIGELRERTENVAGPKPLVYVGGVSYGGPHGFSSSEAGYPPFTLVGANCPLVEKANDPLLGNRHTMLAKEKILEWNPEILFLDLGTLLLGTASGLEELRADPTYRSLTAVQEGDIYALLPNTFYFVNHDAVLANAWFVGKVLYPDRFSDIDPHEKADEIFTFLVGNPVFRELDDALQNLALRRVSLEPKR